MIAAISSDTCAASAVPRPKARSRWVLARLAAVALGLLLVTAASLKLYGINVTAVPRVGWFATPRVQVAAAVWEFVLGFWLIGGASRTWSWLAAVFTFAGFAAVSGYFGYVGVASCGCFGVLRTSPWTAFAVDIGVLLLLAFSDRNPLAMPYDFREARLLFHAEP